MGNEFVDVASGEGSFEEEHDVFNHVFVGDEVEEGGEGFDCLGAKVLEFCNKLCVGGGLRTCCVSNGEKKVVVASRRAVLNK